MKRTHFLVSLVLACMLVLVTTGQQAQASGNSVFFITKLVYAVQVDSYLTVYQPVTLGQEVEWPIMLTEMNGPTDLSQKYIQIGPRDDCTAMGDCVYHPTLESQDGLIVTNYMYIDLAWYLPVGGSYRYYIEHEGTRSFSGHWCYGITGGQQCLQEGNRLYVSLDNYAHVGVGFKSSTYTRVLRTGWFQSMKYQLWATGSILPLCPDVIHTWGSPRAAATTCFYQGVDGYTINIIPAGSVFAPTARRA